MDEMANRGDRTRGLHVGRTEAVEAPSRPAPNPEPGPHPGPDDATRAQLTRRHFLGTVAGVGAVVAAGGVEGLSAHDVASGTGEADDTARAVATASTKRQWAMVFDLRKCEGCVTTDDAPQCIEGCNAEHFVPEGQEWIRVFEMEGQGGHTFFLPRPCMQCEYAPCLNVCPVGATYRNDEGIILIDHDRCIGCRMCMAACPYGVRVFNWGEPANPPGATFATYSPEYPVPHRRGTVEKCMLCAHRADDGKLPACAEACPMFAIYLGDLVTDVATNGKEIVKLSTFLAENSAFRLKEELGTHPRVWYIPGHGQEYGHEIGIDKPMKPARSWQELGATLSQPMGGMK